jgi:hypothetical protein
MFQAATKELIKKWATQENPDEGDGPREFLALVTTTDKAKKKWLEKEPLKTVQWPQHQRGQE